MKGLIGIIVGIALILMVSPARAETQKGLVREVNCGSHSIGLDVPPLIRIYTTGGTRFESEGGKATCQDIKEGDHAEVDLKNTGPGTAIASRIKILKHLEPVKNLASNDIDIKLNQSFLMGVSQTATLQDEGKEKLKIQSTEFINTLCNAYDCGNEGEAGMRFKVTQGGKTEEALLTSKNERKPVKPVQVELFGYTIQLIETGEDVVMLVVRR